MNETELSPPRASPPPPLTPQPSAPAPRKSPFPKSNVLVKGLCLEYYIQCLILTQMIERPPAATFSATPPSKRSLRIAETRKAKRMRARQTRSPSSKISSSSQGKSDSDVPILKPGRRRSLARQKALSDTSDNSVGDTADAGVLGDDDYADGDVDMDAEAKSNPDEYMTGKDDDDLRDEDPVTNIEELFQQVRDQTACERLTKEVLEQTCRFFQHPINKMSLSDRVPVRGLKCGLRPFQALGVFCMFSVEVTTLSGGILADDMGLGKVRHFLLL